MYILKYILYILYGICIKIRYHASFAYMMDISEISLSPAEPASRQALAAAC